jgi:hypothetical protein
MQRLVISCHADTGFRLHRLQRIAGGYHGHLDNFIGVHAVMQAYFSGRLGNTRIELTCGEETDMAGARAVRRTLGTRDIVAVVDVTGYPTRSDLTIEKCKSPAMRSFVRAALRGMKYELFEDCPDPIANEDESDVYRRRTANVFFVGIPCTGGDYNVGMVSARTRSVTAAAEALVRFSRAAARR